MNGLRKILIAYISLGNLFLLDRLLGSIFYPIEGGLFTDQEVLYFNIGLVGFIFILINLPSLFLLRVKSDKPLTLTIVTTLFLIFISGALSFYLLNLFGLPSWFLYF